ncbi:SpoIIE family protein phosphatase [Cellulomonas sp. APG4]|uniref:SpoIIE family protein phosphatase n=1 Tax=Cellulomonas sp. APG4 TaxID=1538656 RepID=UPI00137A4DF4|nr:SpoIIE family protein phosphatase [Cellulomonas sp. APG4]NCT91422.1 SpoIIE family protein phosphatase [Cellulomonas sp. APG4]
MPGTPEATPAAPTPAVPAPAAPATPATGEPTDVIDCADEPIRIPGSVQPHGVLLAVDPATFRVAMASASSAEHLGLAAEDVLGCELTEVLGAEAVPTLPLAEDALDPRTVTLTLADGTRRQADLLVHEADGLLVVEVEPLRSSGPSRALRVRPALRALQRAGTPEDLTRDLARQVRDLTGFDRVMVYRFDDQWNGEVVAEEVRAGLATFAGLHFPASDIPAQARELYARQWMRSIPDARYTPSPLVPPFRPDDGAPLDLAGSALRSVSPVHLEYLANMGVRASMSVSLLVHGRLWGLVACHHESGPHFPDAATRGAAEFLGRTASLLLQGMADAATNVDTLAVAAASGELVRELGARVHDPLGVLADGDRMLDLIEGATGAVARINGETVLVGRTPSRAEVERLHGLLWTPGTAVVASATVGRDLRAEVSDDVVATASGVLGVRLAAGGGRDFLAWLRPEVLREVHWAGDPGTKGYAATPEGLRLTPRASFADWVEQVRGTSEPWTPAQVAAVTRLGQDVDELLVRQRSEQERVTAALRRIVLTERPQLPAGYELTQVFEPSGTDALGGDWYDVTALPDGRVVLMVGDVAGHGIAVAAITAQIRHALRAYLVDDGGAAAALGRISSLISTLLPGELATVVAAEVCPTTNEVLVSRAGHLPALVVRADGAHFVAGADGPALGLDLGPAGTFTSASVHLEPGDCLVLYTDGLVEERGAQMSTSLERFRARAAEVGPDREALGRALRAAGPTTSDDVTLVVLQRSTRDARVTAVDDGVLRAP